MYLSNRFQSILRNAVSDWLQLNSKSEYAPHPADINIEDKKLILQEIAEDYEYNSAIKSVALFDELYKEHQNIIANLLSDEYEEQMSNRYLDSGLNFRHDSINGEPIWY